MNIHQFFQATIDALVKWHNIHYHRDTWIDHWVGAADIEKYFAACNGRLSNPYFYFDWKWAARRRIVHELTKDGALVGIEVWRYLMKGDYKIEPKYLWDSLYEEGFDKFCKATHPHTDKYRDEVLDNLQAISDAGNPEDQMYAILWSLKLQHSGGLIVDSYSKINKTLLNMVRGSGIQMVFTRAEVEKFLRGEYPRLEVRGLYGTDVVEETDAAGDENTQPSAAQS